MFSLKSHALNISFREECLVETRNQVNVNSIVRGSYFLASWVTQ